MIQSLFTSGNIYPLLFIFIPIIISDIFFLNHSKNNFKANIFRTLLYISLALIFAAGIFYYQNTVKAAQFITGYVLEFSLSIDNIFVFILINRSLAIKEEYADYVVLYGIVITIVLRLIIIYFGTALVQRFQFTLVIFGIILIYTAIKMISSGHSHGNNSIEAIKQSFLVRNFSRFFKMDAADESRRMIVVKEGKTYATRVLLAVILAVVSDIVCAVDSIPSVFAITNDVFIIYSSNVFALIGLRSMYGMLHNMLDRFKYLDTGVMIILFLIGIKVILAPFHYEIIGPFATCAIVLGILSAAIIVSLLKNNSSEGNRGH